MRWMLLRSFWLGVVCLYLGQCDECYYVVCLRRTFHVLPYLRSYFAVYVWYQQSLHDRYVRLSLHLLASRVWTYVIRILRNGKNGAKSERETPGYCCVDVDGSMNWSMTDKFGLMCCSLFSNAVTNRIFTGVIIISSVLACYNSMSCLFISLSFSVYSTFTSLLYAA